MISRQANQGTLQDGFWEFDRFYGNWAPGKYVFPIDEVGYI